MVCRLSPVGSQVTPFVKHIITLSPKNDIMKDIVKTSLMYNTLEVETIS